LSKSLRVGVLGRRPWPPRGRDGGVDLYVAMNLRNDWHDFE
jgi:hypothetical protein